MSVHSLLSLWSYDMSKEIFTHVEEAYLPYACSVEQL